MTRLPASVGIATTGDVGTTGVNRGAMTAGTRVAVAVAVAVEGVVSFVRSAEAVAGEIASVVSVAVAVVTGTAIPDLANCRSRRKACA